MADTKMQSKTTDVNVNMGRINVVAFLLFDVPTAIGAYYSWIYQSAWPVIVGVLVGWLVAQSPKIARQWERGIILRLGKYVGKRGPGLFWIVPFIDTVTSWIDQRTITTNFAAEETLTSDTVPVNVDAVLFWMVHDPEKAALEVQNYAQAVSWAAQTALRDVVIPDALQDAMSREAQAAREKQARIILGQAEMEIASSFATAAKSYHDNPTALHLRAMNMLYEGLKEKGALMLVPSTAVESMGMGGLLGAAAMRQQALAEGTNQPGGKT